MMVELDLSYCECGCGEDHERQDTLARDHINGLRHFHSACPVCRHPSMHRSDCTDRDHLRAIGWDQ
jgi:hypothetical protein